MKTLGYCGTEMFALHQYLTKKVFFSLANKKKSHTAMVHVLSPNKSSKQIWATQSGKKKHAL